jgi:hypothetical protein
LNVSINLRTTFGAEGKVLGSFRSLSMFMSHRWNVWNEERWLLKAIGDSSPQWSAILKTFESN